MEKGITTSTYSFEKLRQGGFVYVDKTNYVYDLIRPQTGQYFCARPRRFGKSLFLSTLEALFRGRKELFKGLFIENGTEKNGKKINYEWETFPVIHLNLAGCSPEDPDQLEAWLKDAVREISEEYGIGLADNYSDLMFKNLIRRLAKETGKRVVLLLDEYDKPLTDNIYNPELPRIKVRLEKFYGVIKEQEERLRFTFITGVTKFSQVSIFSKLNNLTDISLSKDTACMFGYTQEELETFFGDYICKAVQEGIFDEEGKKLTKEEFLRIFKEWYDGFRFYPTSQPVYNPVSVGSFFNAHADFSYYWFSTGTSSWLEQIAGKQPLTLRELTSVPVPKSVFAEFNIENFANGNFGKVDLIKLLYQTGYLTLDEDPEFLRGQDNPYHLSFPNWEVEEAYMRLLLNAWFPKRQDYTRVGILQALETGDTDLLRRHLEGFYASIPYELFPEEDKEKTYQMMMYILFRIIGEDVRVEEHTNIGRIDVVLDGKKHLFILELKLDHTAGDAMDQIEDRNYVQKYLIPAQEQGKKIMKIGVNFSSKRKNIDEWTVETNPA